MGAYDYMDSAIAGLKNGLAGRVEGGWVCAEPLGIPYGYPVFGHLGNDKSVYSYKNDVAKIVYSADFIASNSAVITVDGVAITATVYATDHDAQIAAMVVKLNALAGIEAVLDPADTDSRTILIQKKTKSFVTNDVTSVITGGSSVPTVAVTYGSSQVFLGVSLFVQKAPSLGVTTNQGYEQYESVAVMADGEIWVPVSAAVKANNEAYVSTSGAGIAKFAASGLAVSARYKSNAASGALAILNVSGQTEATYANNFVE